MTATLQHRILIVDDHAVFSEALGLMLGLEPDFEVAAKCSSVEEALAIVAKQYIELVLLDLTLVGTRGSAFCTVARELGFQGKILILTAEVAREEAIRLIADGASGIFLKRTPAELLVAAIRKVLTGETWIDPHLAGRGPESADSERMHNLTERERLVLMGVFEGLTNKEVGARLRLSEESVKASVQQLFSKLGARTRVHLARKMMDYIGERGRTA